MNQHSRLHEITLKYHRGEALTAEEQAILNAEKESLPAKRVWERVRSHVEASREKGKVRPLYSVLSGAAAVLVLIGGGIYFYVGHNSDRKLATIQRISKTVAPGHFYQELEGPEGIEVVDSASNGQSVPYPVVLPDGSKITLSYASSIRYRQDFSERKVILSGQAHFDVVTDPSRPFAVESGKTTVQVLGTRFNWMHYPNIDDEVTLLDGKVKLLRGSFSDEMRPGERAVIHEAKVTRVAVQRMQRPEETVAWMGARPEVVFDRTDLYQVIKRIAQYYNVGYRVDAALQTGRPVTGVLSLQRRLAENLEVIAEIVKDYNVRVVDNNGVIEVTN